MKIEDLKSEVETYLIKNGSITYYTPLGCFARSYEWVGLEFVNGIKMRYDFLARFLVFIIN
jgi:hypothetical protein